MTKERYVSLGGEVWNGRTRGGATVIPEGIRLIVPATVADEDMACGGRECLHEMLKSNERGQVASMCIECDVKKICVLGLALA